MTDFILRSNESSVIIKSLADAETQNLSYEIAPSYPSLAKQYREIQSNNAISGAPAGQEVTFNINKSALLRDLQIKTAWTTTTTSQALTYKAGLHMFESIQLKTNNKVIMTMSDAYIMARTEQEGEAKQNAIYRRALQLTPTTEVPIGATTVTSCVTYTPVFSTFFENNANNCLDLNFYEQLSLTCKFNTSARAGLVIPMDTATCTLWVWTYRLEDKAYDVLRSQNQSPSRPLNMLAYNTFTEVQACVGTTQQVMRLNTNYPVFNTYIMIKGVVDTTLGEQFKIDSFDFSMGGTKLLESVPYLVGNWDSSSKGASQLETTSITATTYNDTKCVAINWGIEPWNRVSNSGACSFGQINYPQITVNHQTLTAASYSVYVVHEYWNILTLDSSNGSVNISVSS